MRCAKVVRRMGGFGVDHRRSESSFIPAEREDPQVEVGASEAADSEKQDSSGTRRRFLGCSVRKLAYVSPVVLLLRPRPACASRIYS